MNRGRSIVAMWAALVVAAVAGASSPLRAAEARQTFVVGDFDTIRLEAPIDATVTSGRGASAVGTGDRRTLDALDLRSNGRTLVIRLRRPAIGDSKGAGGKARLTLTTGTLASAAVVGAGRLQVDRLKGGRGEAAINGSGVLSIDAVQLDKASLGIAGSGQLSVAGRVGDAVVLLRGAGTLQAGELTAQRLRLDAAGSAEADIAVIGTATLNASGGVRIAVAGKPTCTVRSTGNAQVRCGGTDY